MSSGPRLALDGVESTAIMDAVRALSEIRTKANVSQGRLAQLLETSLASVSRWEQGIGTPSPTQAERIVSLHRVLVEGQISRESNTSLTAFPSRRGRGRLSGQGILGQPFSSVELTDEVRPPILARLLNGRFFSGEGEATIGALLKAHEKSAITPTSPLESDISAGKNTYTYDAHTYHTKVPPQGIAELLSYYLPRGGLALDPFAGSGMTGVAARALGLDCILNELSPAASFIANRFVSTVSPVEFEAAVQAVLKELKPLRQHLYSTTCRECGKATELLYTVWSYKVLCNRCGTQFLLWDCCRQYGQTVREHKILTEFPCPSCSVLLKKSMLARTDALPVMVGYKCCGSKQQEVTHALNDSDKQLIALLEGSAPLVDSFFPKHELPDGVNLRQPKKHGLSSVDKFYTRRNLSALSHLWQTIHRIDSLEVAAHLAFVFTSLYRRVTKLSEFRFWGGSGNTARLNVPHIFDEANIFVSFERKAQTILDHLETTARTYKGRTVVINNSATDLDYLPSDSVDLIFTDPPFGANINYSEMNFLWEAWLGSFTDARNEAVMNRIQGKGVREYEFLMRRCLAECFRVLRPGHWMLLVFMNSSKEVWEALRKSIVAVGFEISKTQIFDKQHGTFKQFVSDNTAGMDLVLHCRKPATAAFPDRETSRWTLAPSVANFLEAKGPSLPRSVYLHVERSEEVDFRTLYSEWLAQSINSARDLLDFVTFRKIAMEWLEGRRVS